MINKPFLYALIITPLLSTTGHAFLCPTNFNQINFGDPQASVEELCGKPDKSVTTDVPDNSPQEWNYYLRPAATVNTMPQAQQAQGTLKTSFAFDAAGSLINISINGVGVASTSDCGSPISLGDSRKSVEAACGQASMITKQTPSGPANQEAKKQIENSYNSTPPVTLIFEDGKLTDKR